jgi:hypothetical protein
LAVLPDTDDIWEEKDGSVLVDSLALGFSDIGLDAANFDGGACRFSSACGSIV